MSQKPKGKKNPQSKTSGDPCRKQTALPIEAWTQSVAVCDHQATHELEQSEEKLLQPMEDSLLT